MNNGSENILEIKALVRFNEKIELIDLKHNYGIAAALNRACEKGISEGYEWILTLDQDSVCMDNLVQNYLNYINMTDIGQMTCIIQDRNTRSIEAISENYRKVEWAITSGAFVRLAAWKKINGFDEKLFIDGVDYDFSLTLAEHGFCTIRINYIGLLHEVGKISKEVRVFGKKHQVFNHNKLRRYYICRNNIYIARKHKKLSVIKAFLKNIARIIFVFLFENQKFEKLKAGVAGLRDGFRL